MVINNKLTSVTIYLTKYHRFIHISRPSRNVDHTLKPTLDLLLAAFLVYFEISIRVFSAVDTRLLFPHGEFVDVLHTISGKMADIAEQAEIVWCLNPSETEFVVCFFS